MSISAPTPQRESRNIVLCFDGTNNAFLGEQTNVYRLYSLLDHGEQATFYAPGVGTHRRSTVFTRVRFSTLRRSLNEVRGLLFGFGFYEDVGEGYRFLMNHYLEGDRIHLFGFSRGAYTARVLAGLLHRLGLPRAGNEHLVPYALDLYRTRIKTRNGWEPAYGKMGRFKSRFSPYKFDEADAPVRYMGLWDSVSALGLVHRKLRLPNTDKNPIIRQARHAIALDERRGFYRPPRIYETESSQSYREAWFAGVHSDVGGGYKRWGLGRSPLEWILVGALRAGLRLSPEGEGDALGMVEDEFTARHGNKPEPRSDFYKRHESLRCLWHIAELIPRWHHSYDPPSEDGRWLWRSNRWQYRPIPTDAKLHETACLYHESDVYSMRDREQGSPSTGDDQCHEGSWERWEKLADTIEELHKTPPPRASLDPAGSDAQRDKPPSQD